MTSTRGITQPTVTTILPVKTPTNQLNPSDTQFSSALQRWQTGVNNTLDQVLSFLNSHFSPAPPTRSSDGRTVTRDLTTLVAADTGCAIESAYPLTFSIPTSAVPASATNAVVYQLPLAKGAEIVAVYVYSPVATAGSAQLKIADTDATVSVALGAGAQRAYDITPPISVTSLGEISALQAVTVTSSSSWVIPAGTVYVTLYVAQGVG